MHGEAEHRAMPEREELGQVTRAADERIVVRYAWHKPSVSDKLPGKSPYCEFYQWRAARVRR